MKSELTIIFVGLLTIAIVVISIATTSIISWMKNQINKRKEEYVTDVNLFENQEIEEIGVLEGVLL